MDFAFDDTAVAVGNVADDVFARHQPVWESRFGMGGPSGDSASAATFDEPLWQALLDAGVITLPLPSRFGGDDLDVLALLPLLRRMGASAAVTPALGTLAGGLEIARGSGAAGDRAAEKAAGGGKLAVAISEPGDALSATPHTTIRNGRLNGTKVAVLYADDATLLVTTDGGVAAVDPAGDGVSVRRTPTSSGWAEYTVTFDDVAVSDDDIVSSSSGGLRDLYRLVLAGYADGLVAGATTLTAGHVSERQQFGKPIALFQAVGQQLADIYVVGRSMTLATTSAAWRLSESLDAPRDLGIATYWMAAELPATLRTMTHLHGGIGVDITYPLHRYFSIAKDLARVVGGGDARLDELADLGELADVH